MLPPFGFMLLVAWRQVRPGLLPVWAGLPLGLFDDIYSGQPFGSAMLLWSLAMILLELVEARFPWRNFLLDWLVSAVLIGSLPCLFAGFRQCGGSFGFDRDFGAPGHDRHIPVSARGPAGRAVRPVPAGAFRGTRLMLSESRHVSSATLTHSFDRRSVVLGALQGGVGVLLALRMAWIAIFQNEKYELEAESNRVNLTLIPPRRGWILDRNGAPLASNRADFRVDIIPDRLVDGDATVAEVGRLLQLTDVQLQDLRDKLEKSHGFQPVEAASGIDADRYAAVSVRLPDLPGVVPQRGFSRYYPTGPSVGHLIGYVGPASAEEYDREKNPLLVTPGFKIGKDGLEKHFEKNLRGGPGARRVEVTAGGKIVRDLDTREDVPGKPIKLTIDGPLQDYAARRLGPESGAVVVMDCNNGDLLCASSMPSFDPNSFFDGIGRIEWKMLSDDDHVPLRNKVLRGLYPPGSTVKPMVAMAFLEAGLDPEETASLRRRPARRQPRVPLLEPARPRHGQHGQGHLPELRRLFLSLRPEDRHGEDRRHGEALRARPGIRAAGDRPVLWHGARSRLEDAQVRQGMGGVRYGERHDRPGLHAGEPAATGGDGRAHCHRAKR